MGKGIGGFRVSCLEMAVQPRPASTVVPMAAEGKELFVCMVRRSSEGAFADHLVFPGGTLKELDGSEPARRRTAGLSEEGAEEELSAGPGSILYYRAALRETFEEVGLVVASVAGAGADGAFRALAVPYQERVEFYDFLESRDLVARLDRLIYFSHWITPEFVPKRFDTRFFILLLEEPIELTPDGREIEDALWAAPRDVLEKCEKGIEKLAFPTVKHLERFAQLKAGEDLAAQLRRMRPRGTVLPRLVGDRLDIDQWASAQQ